MHADGVDMSVSFLGLLMVAGMAGVMFLAVLGLMTLLTNPKTRDMAKILLGGLAALILLVFLVGLVVGLLSGVSRHRAVAHQETVHRQIATERLRALGEESRVVVSGSPATIELSADVDADSPKSEAESADLDLGDTELPPDPRERLEMAEDAEAESSEPAEATEDEAVTEVVDSPKEESGEEAAAAPEEPKESDVGELSVAPLPDENRPAWVDRKPYKEGSVYYWPVAADPRPDEDQAEFEALPEALNQAVADYIEQKLRLGSLASRRVHLDPTYLRDRLVGEDVWVEPRSLSVGEFVRMHALVKFDREANSILREAWGKERAVGRLWSAGGILALALLLLSIVYSYLKIDQVTDGSRRRLLRFAAILVILGLMLVAAGVASVGIA